MYESQRKCLSFTFYQKIRYDTMRSQDFLDPYIGSIGGLFEGGQKTRKSTKNNQLKTLTAKHQCMPR